MKYSRISTARRKLNFMILNAILMPIYNVFNYTKAKTFSARFITDFDTIWINKGFLKGLLLSIEDV